MLTLICRSYLAILSTYHVVTGVVSFCFPVFAMRFYKMLYACDPVERRQLTLIMKPWGALSVFAGICGFFAVVDPIRYSGVMAALLLLLTFRIVYRICWSRDLGEIGRIPPHRNLINIVILVIGDIILSTWLVSFILTGEAS